VSTEVLQDTRADGPLDSRTSFPEDDENRKRVTLGEVPERPIGPVSKDDKPIFRLPQKMQENPGKQAVSALPGILPKRSETSRNEPLR
jgi:hypothetical protein